MKDNIHQMGEEHKNKGFDLRGSTGSPLSLSKGSAEGSGFFNLKGNAEPPLPNPPPRGWRGGWWWPLGSLRFFATTLRFLRLKLFNSILRD